MRKQMSLTCYHVTNVDGVLERVQQQAPKAANEKTHMSGSHTFHNLPLPESVALIESTPASSASCNWSKSETVFFALLQRVSYQYKYRVLRCVAFIMAEERLRLSAVFPDIFLSWNMRGCQMLPSLQLPKFVFAWFQFIEWIRPQMRALPLTSLGRHHRAQDGCRPSWRKQNDTCGDGAS